MDFLDIDKVIVQQKLLAKGGVKLVDLPKNLTRQNVDNAFEPRKSMGEWHHISCVKVVIPFKIWYKYDSTKKSCVNQRPIIVDHNWSRTS